MLFDKMSSDSQPRKRKDNKKKLKDDEPQNEDINIHVHKEHSTGGGMCAKLVFVLTSCALVILIGLIIKENREISELENIETESRFAQAFEGWIEEHVDDHSPESLDHEDNDHDHEDDDDDHGHEDEDEDEEEATEETEDTEENEHDSQDEEPSTEQDEDEGDTVEEDIDEESQAQSVEETIEDENTEENEEEEIDGDNESHEDTKESLYIKRTPVQRLSKYKPRFSKKPIKDYGDDKKDDKDKTTIIQEKLSKYKTEKIKVSKRSIEDDIEKDKKDESTEDETDNKDDEDEEKTDNSIKDGEEDENKLNEEDHDQKSTVEQDEETIVDAAEKSHGPDASPSEVVEGGEKDGTEDATDGDKEEPQPENTEDESRASTKIGVGVALLYVAYKVFLRRQTDPELERPPRRESEHQSETPTSRSRRNTIIPPPTLEEVEADLNQVEDTGQYSEDEYSDEESVGEHHMSPKEEYQELRTTYSRSLTPEGDFVSKKSSQLEMVEPRYAEEEEEEEEEYQEEELSEEESDSPGEDIESSEEAEEDEDDDEALLKRLEAKYGRIGRDVTVPSEAAESDSDRQSDDEYSNITNKEDQKIRSKIDEATETIRRNAALANKLFDVLLKNYPHSPRVLYGKALTLHTLADQKRSNDLLNMAVSFYAKVMDNEDVPDALFIKAAERYIDRQTFLGNYKKTIPAFTKLIDKFPNDRSYVNKLIITYMTMNEIEEARTKLKEILIAKPNDGFALVHYGFILKTTDNNLDEAIKYLEEGLKSEERIVQDGRFYYHLGDALIRLGRKEDAMRVFENGVKNKVLLSKYQRSLYNVPKLSAKPWWTSEDLPSGGKLIQTLKNNWQSIKKEALTVLNERGYFMDEKENLKETGEWKQLDLFVRGQKLVKNCAKTPVTCNIIQKFPEASKCRRGQTKFSIMHPNTHVWAHCGPTNTRLRIHLGLVVPQGTSIRVAEETRTWKEGDVIIFDDSFEHEVWHNGTSSRLVLIIDVWHPELSESLKKSLPPI